MALRKRPHLLFTCLNDLIREERILDAIEDLYGENLLVWYGDPFIKEPSDPAFVSWHQDSTYWGLSTPNVVTAWVALSESNKANGALEVVPGTYLKDQLPHRDTFAKDNLLSRGQEIAVEVDPGTSVMLELEPSEMSLHHVRLIHGSAPNRSKTQRRIGFAIRYIPTYVRQLDRGNAASLVRGVGGSQVCIVPQDGHEKLRKLVSGAIRDNALVYTETTMHIVREGVNRDRTILASSNEVRARNSETPSCDGVPLSSTKSKARNRQKVACCV